MKPTGRCPACEGDGVVYLYHSKSEMRRLRVVDSEQKTETKVQCLECFGTGEIEYEMAPMTDVEFRFSDGYVLKSQTPTFMVDEREVTTITRNGGPEETMRRFKSDLPEDSGKVIWVEVTDGRVPGRLKLCGDHAKDGAGQERLHHYAIHDERLNGVLDD